MEPLVYDSTEIELGIAKYLREDVEGFSAVSKARFSDFVVHEVGMDGQIARLESIEPVLLSQADAKETDGPVTEVAPTLETIYGDPNRKRKADEVEAFKPDWPMLQTELSDLVDATVAVEVVEFLQSIEANDKPPLDKFVKLPPVAEKEKRRALHQWIKSRLSFCAAADTEQDHIRIWHSSFARFMPNKLDRGGNRPNHGPAIPHAPRNMPYLRFVLYKENMDSGAAMQQLSNRAGFKGHSRGGRGGGRGGRGSANTRIRLGYAGNKDKRGITSQFITIPARDTAVKHLCNVFNGTNAGRGGGGGGHTKAAGVGLMRVGNFEYCTDQLQLGRLRGNRFDVALRNVAVAPGSIRSTAPTVLAQAAAAMRVSGFINYFGLQRFGKYHDTHLTGMAVLRGDYQAAVDQILAPKTNDRMDVYDARVQWQSRFGHLKEGEDRAVVEKQVAEQVLKCMNSYMQSENAILNSLVRHPLDYKKAFSCIVKTMRMMFIHALQSFVWNKAASFRIDSLGRSIVVGDLVLKNPDANSTRGDGCPDVKVVTEDDIAAQRYTMEDVVLPLIGAKTREPENASGDIFDAVLQENNVTRDMINQLDAQDFHCAGDYRKLICRPTDIDFEIIEYLDELQPLLQTDVMKLNQIQVVKHCETDTKSEKAPLLGMVIGFSLPSSSYATVFLRELMKRPTSSEYQSELKLGGDVDTTEVPAVESVVDVAAQTTESGA